MLSLEEKERRINAIREKMEERGIDVRLVSSSSDLMERGKVRYITYWPTVLFDHHVILPDGISLFAANHYVVTDQGGHCLHQTPNEIILV